MAAPAPSATLHRRVLSGHNPERHPIDLRQAVREQEGEPGLGDRATTKLTEK